LANGDGVRDAVVELKNPRMTGDQLTFDVRVLEGDLSGDVANVAAGWRCSRRDRPRRHSVRHARSFTGLAGEVISQAIQTRAPRHRSA
jgi:hypothetical protein